MAANAKWNKEREKLKVNKCNCEVHVYALYLQDRLSDKEKEIESLAKKVREQKRVSEVIYSITIFTLDFQQEIDQNKKLVRFILGQNQHGIMNMYWIESDSYCRLYFTF